MRHRFFPVIVVGLIFVVLLALWVLMAVTLDSSGQVVPTWTPRPTGPPVTLTPVFLPLVEKSATPTR